MNGNEIRVLKGNREMLISPSHKEEYLLNGYSVIDETGKVLEQKLKSEDAVRAELEAANKRIVELEAELEAANKRRGRKGSGAEQPKDDAPGSDETGEQQ